jgi:NAD(P)H-hydrate epimerase
MGLSRGWIGSLLADQYNRGEDYLFMADIENLVYSPRSVRQLDRIAIEDEGIAGYTLMTRAGQAAFALARSRFPDAQRWLVVCGAGNNAGDGYVIARLARAANLQVTVAALSAPDQLQGDAQQAWRDYRAEVDGSTQPVVTFEASLCANSDLIIDAVLGTGIGRPLTGAYLEAVQAMAGARVPVIAVDVPSGLNSETGEVMGCAVKASATVTFVGLKQGLFLGVGPEHAGEICFSDLNIPPEVAQRVAPTLRIFAARELAELLPRRPATSHKGRFGHVLIIGGNHGMAGAARLAGEAALRSGAGLVSIASRPETVSAITAGRPELMCHPITSVDDLEPLMMRASVIALGPGLGQDGWAKDLFGRILDCPQPKVLDADALNLLAENPARREDWILTPHPGEAGRLLGLKTDEVQADRLSAVQSLVKRYGGVSVLKGRCTLIGAAGKLPYLIDCGNPGMATAGMGDVLTGLTAGIIAQFPDSMQTGAAAAAYAHALAGDRAASRGQRGLIATDLFAELRPILNPDA